jgi:MYXO-CTERM domain-containing protein
MSRRPEVERVLLFTMRNSNRWVHLFAIIGLTLAPSVAGAHIRLTEPKPRSTADNLKPPAAPPPCGNVAPTAPVAQYAPGSNVTVKWVETISHSGCFQIAFSSNGTDFTVLKQITDPNGGPTMFTETVALPTGVTCEKCVIQLRQLMLENATVKTCGANQAPPSGAAGQGNTYYSCSDIRVGNVADGGAGPIDSGAPPVDAGDGTGMDDGGSSPDGSTGSTRTPDAGGGDEPAATTTRNASPSPGTGCGVAHGAAATAPLVLFASFLGLGLLRRRRPRS